jgi:hypothetical protein
LGSAAGLFFIRGNLSDSIFVYNPITANFSTLPSMTLEECYLIAGIGIMQEGDEYKMVMVHHSAMQSGQRIVVTYNSTEKAWSSQKILPSLAQ